MANLFVGAEADAKCRVRQLGVGAQACDERHDFGNARLVVGSEQRRTVRADEVLANQAVECRELIGADRHGGAVNDSAHKVAAFIVHDVRLYAKARDDLRRVEMGDKAESRPSFRSGAGGDPGGHISVLAHGNLLGP